MTLTYSIYPKQDYTYPPVVQQRNRWFSLKPPFRSRIFHGFSTYFPLPRFLVPEGILYWLVVYLPLWKMMEFVSWDDGNSQLNGKNNVPNHQPAIGYTSCCWHWWTIHETPPAVSGSLRVVARPPCSPWAAEREWALDMWPLRALVIHGLSNGYLKM